MTRTAIRPILGAVAVAWVAALFVAAFVVHRPSANVGLLAFSAAVYEIGSLVCHQLPNRSFYFWGSQLPVCARCTGLYVGAAAAPLAAALIGPAVLRRLWDRARQLVLVAAVPTAVTLIQEWISGNMPPHWIRAAAGFPLGAIVMLIVLAATTLESVVEVH
jgi:uncharacterized membrane protein